ncbi:MAG: hypothetical protein Q7T20_01065 [Saprospiraceae bacterium]|nr:hypothetical protein [Saprospiraceae bacterium]
MQYLYFSHSIQLRTTGSVLSTFVLLASQEDVKTLSPDWLFNWENEVRLYNVYKLVLAEQPDLIQGLMSVEIRAGFVFVSLIENAPFNRESDKTYRGVAINLFAFACKLSAEKGFDGFVAFEAKTDLIAYYQTLLGAQQIGNSNRMFIEESQAQKLIQLHF